MNAPKVTLFVPGIPAPQGSKRHVGGGRLIEMSRKLKPWREAVRAGLLRAEDPRRFPLFARETPVLAELVFTVPAPQRLPKMRPVWSIRTPDLDKLVRSTFDAITASGVWADDAQVVELKAVKTYPSHAITAHANANTEPGVHIVLTEVGGLRG